jgi:hypothetical protein
MKRLSIAVVMLVSSGAACKKKVDTADFEGRLKKRTDELGLTGATVSCPKGVEAKEGQSFDCSVSVGGKTYVLVATVTKVDGKELGMDTKWKEGEAIINTKLAPLLGAELSKQFGTPVTTDCGKDTMVFLDKDRNVTCDLTAGETKAKVLVTFDDKLNPTNWKLDPQLLGKTNLEGILLEPVRAKTSPGIAVTCGDRSLFPRPADGTVWCEIAEGEKKAKLKVAVDESLKVTSWEVAE